MINQIPPQRVDDYEYLGVTLDCHLSINDAISKTCSCTAYKLYLFGLIRKYLNQRAAINVFKAMILPYIDYPLFLFSTATDKLLTKLQRLQNGGLRICLKAPARSSVSLMHQDCNVKNRMQINILKSIHRQIYQPHSDDVNISNTFTHNTLGPMFNELCPNSSRFQCTLCGISYTLWNGLTVGVRKMHDRNAFKNTIKRDYIRQQVDLGSVS